MGDPSSPLSDKQAKKMRKFVNDFLDRAVEKYGEHQKRKAARASQKETKDGEGLDERADRNGGSAADRPAGSSHAKDDVPMADELDEAALSDNDGPRSSTSPDRKRKREVEVEASGSPSLASSEGPTVKRVREDEMDEPSPPPPPPPPPQSAMENVMTAEQQALREQEEALVRENEEAQRLEDEANRTKCTEDATRGAEKDAPLASNEPSQLSHEAQGSA